MSAHIRYVPPFEVLFADGCAWRAVYLNVRRPGRYGELILVQVARLVVDPGCGGRASFSGYLLGLQWRFAIPFMQWKPGQGRARSAWQRWVHSFDGRLKLRRGAR